MPSPSPRRAASASPIRSTTRCWHNRRNTPDQGRVNLLLTNSPIVFLRFPLVSRNPNRSCGGTRQFKGRRKEGVDRQRHPDRTPAMPNPTPTAASGLRPIDSKAAAQAVITELAEVMDGLESVLVEETALVRAGQLRKATGLEPRKAELCGRYFKAAER